MYRHYMYPITCTVITCTYTLLQVLILGSGGLSIGQAGEFDYSGSQVCNTKFSLSSDTSIHQILSLFLVFVSLSHIHAHRQSKH